MMTLVAADRVEQPSFCRICNAMCGILVTTEKRITCSLKESSELASAFFRDLITQHNGALEFAAEKVRGH